MRPLASAALREAAASGFQRLAGRIEQAMAYAPPGLFEELAAIKVEARNFRDAMTGAVEVEIAQP